MKLFHPKQYFVYPEEQELYQIYSTVVLKVLYSQTNLKGEKTKIYSEWEKAIFGCSEEKRVPRNCTFRYQRRAEVQNHVTNREREREEEGGGRR